MDLFAKKIPENAQRSQQIKMHVAKLLGLEEEATVMVTELNCQDEDCPEIETVIAIFRPNQTKLQITLHSGISEITDVEIEKLCLDIENRARDPQEPLLLQEK
jgi:hypothetical protein